MSGEGVNLVLHVEGDVYWLLNGSESTSGFAFKEHILDVRGGRIHEGVQIVEAPGLDLAGLLLGVDEGQILVDNKDGVLGDHDGMRELGCPLNSSNICDGKLMKDFSCAEIVHEKSVISLDQKTAQRCWENHVDPAESLLQNRPFL